MKNNIDSNFAIAILALTTACVGFAFWLDGASSEIAELSEITIEQSYISNKTPDHQLSDSQGEMIPEKTIPYIVAEVEGWNTYYLPELEIEIDVPSHWDFREGVTYQADWRYPYIGSGMDMENQDMFGDFTTHELRPYNNYFLEKGERKLRDIESKVLGEFITITDAMQEESHSWALESTETRHMEIFGKDVKVYTTRETDGDRYITPLGDPDCCRNFADGEELELYRTIITADESNEGWFGDGPYPPWVYISHKEKGDALRIIKSIKKKTF